MTRFNFLVDCQHSIFVDKKEFGHFRCQQVWKYTTNANEIKKFSEGSQLIDLRLAILTWPINWPEVIGWGQASGPSRNLVDVDNLCIKWVTLGIGYWPGYQVIFN